jgi:cytidylate kinase
MSGPVPPGASSRIVTVDGPAGSGKSTLGRHLALALGLPLIDTGLFYRAVMVAARRAGLPATDPRIGEIAASADIELNTDPHSADGRWSIRLDGDVVDDVARDPANATLLAEISRLPGVRAALLPRQRALAIEGAVAVGRDCGTVVFPWASVKIYLQAAAEVRTGRRADQLRGGGTAVDDAGLRAEVAGRDELDSGRAVAPLRPADDAHIIDTGVVGIEAMVAIALALCRDAGLLPTTEDHR